jgi:8-oxo-dGTP diphosphatase
VTRPVTPLLAVDVVIRVSDEGGGYGIVLIERRNPPFGWAFPGGFVDIGETLESAAVREMREETSLDVTLEALLGCYSDPSRDARGHTVSAVYIGSAPGIPMAADDAKTIRVVNPQDPGVELAFDHHLILEDYLAWRESGRPAPLRA